jgi:hypothetical protein
LLKDLKIAAAWYEQLLGRPADSTPMPEVAEWKFKRGGRGTGARVKTLMITDMDGNHIAFAEAIDTGMAR